MNPFTTLGRIVAVALALVVSAPAQMSSALEISVAAAPVISQARPSNSSSPTISGSARVAFTLKVTKGSWRNSPTSFTYQWYRCTTKPAAAATASSACSAITGSTSTTYLVTEADLGKHIAASVKAKNRDGSTTKVSAGTSAVVAQYLPPTNTTAPAVSGNKTVSQTLTVSNGSWSESPAEYAYQWFRCTATKTAANALPTGCSELDGETESTYTLVTADASRFILASVAATNSTGTVTKWSASTTVIAALARPSNTTAPTVTGTATNALTLTATKGSWSNYPSDYSYQWFRCTARKTTAATSLPAGCANIADATSSTYVLGDADVAKFIGVAVTGTNAIGSASKWSVSTASAVAALPVPVNTVSPTVSGTAQVSRVLTLANGTWNYRPTSYSYKWYSCTATKAAAATLPAGCTQISGATASTHQLLAGQQSRFVLGSVTATNSRGSASRFTATTGSVGVPAPYAPAPLARLEVEIAGTSGDAISGRAMVGSVLVADEGTWLGYPIPTKEFSYWYRCAQPIAESSTTQPDTCYVIEESEGVLNHVVTLEDLGYYLIYEVIAANTQGVVRNYTPSTDAVTATPVAYVQPTLSGDATFGSTLDLDGGEWSTPPSVGVELFYSWYRCESDSPTVISGLPIDCALIEDANDSAYDVAEEDLGFYVFGVTTAVNDYDESASAIATTLGLSQAVPQLTSTPTVSGTRVSGNDLTVSDVEYIAYPEATVTVQWFRCSSAISGAVATVPGTCTAIAGETDSAYTLVDADLSRFVTARTVVTNALGSVTTLAASTVAVGSVPVFTVAPVISGTTVVESTLTSTAGTATGTPTPTRTYQWLRCTDPITSTVDTIPDTCTSIAGATATTYVSTLADTGLHIAVRVNAVNNIATTTIVTATTNKIDVAPSRVTAPVVSGTLTRGEQLSVTDGAWTAHPTPTITYQWLRCTAAVAANTFTTPATCSVIEGEVASMYTTAVGDVGKFVTAIVTATNTRGTASSVAVASTAIASIPETVANPEVTGTATRGSTLTTTQIAWTGTPTPSTSLQWYRCIAAVDVVATTVPDGCASIAGATSSTYTIVSADAGKYLTVGSTGSNVAGTAYRIGLSTTMVQSLPTVSVAPTITGNRWMGSEITVDDGTWFEYPEATVTYQWYRCSSPVVAASTVPAHCSESITGATSNTYLLDGADSGKYLTAVVEHTNTLGTTRHITAQSIATFLPPSIETEPALTGTAEVGSTLFLGEGLWSGIPAPTTSMSWYSCSEYSGNSINNLPSDCQQVSSRGLVPSSLGLGVHHSCAAQPSGHVLCWGLNSDGQLGNGSKTNATAPVLVEGLEDAIAVSAGANHTCAVKQDGQIACWGDNSAGQLGNIGIGTMSDQVSPVLVDGITDAIGVDVGTWHSCAIVGDLRQVKCWGWNGYGTLGDGTTTSRYTPVYVSDLTGVVSLSAEFGYTCASDVASLVWCWGRPPHISSGWRTAPELVPGLTNAIEVKTGTSHACVLTDDGRVKCWGYGGGGQLGDGEHETRRTPVYVTGGVEGVVSLALNDGSSCAVLIDGGIRCWGENDSFQLGRLSRDSNGASPQQVVGLSEVGAAAAGGDHFCAISRSGVFYCWGNNASGQLGNGSTVATRWNTLPALVTYAPGSFFQVLPDDLGRFIGASVVARNSGATTTFFAQITQTIVLPPGTSTQLPRTPAEGTN